MSDTLVAMRAILLAFLLALLLPASATADVIMPGGGRSGPSWPRRPLPRPPVEAPAVPPEAPGEPVNEPWHPNVDIEPQPVSPEEAGMALAAIGVLVLALSVRESRRRLA